MSVYTLCVLGEHLHGKAQKVTLSGITTMADLISALEDKLVFTQGHSTVESVSVFDEDFQEYILLPSLDGAPHTLKVKVHTSGVVGAGLSNEQAALEQVKRERDWHRRLEEEVLFPQLSLMSNGKISSERLASLCRDAAMDTKLPFEQLIAPLQKLLASSNTTPLAAPAATYSATSAVTPGPRKSVLLPTSATQPKKAAAPALAPPTILNNNPTIAAQAAPNTSAKPDRASGGNDAVVVYCVYSGTTSQRAKAIRVDPVKPYFEGVLSTLQQKFQTDLSLGFINEDGEFIEVTSDDSLKRMIDEHAQGGSLTLHCWTKASAYQEASTMFTAADGDAEAQGATANKQVVKASRKCAPQQSARASSRAGSRASSVTSISKASHKSLRNAKHTSGVFYTEEQLRELFNELDDDGSGALSAEELRDLYRTGYDDMGIVDSQKKFDDLLEKTGVLQDGKVTFEEFCLIMLQMAQW